jgi:pimeloyl-ACP methyl ester carboxylesterase
MNLPPDIKKIFNLIAPCKLFFLTMLFIILNMIEPVCCIPDDRDYSMDPSEQCVVLLHGLARTERSMEEMGDALLKAGYTVFNIEYPSREKIIEELAMETIPKGIKMCNSINKKQINFVTHSMGGIVLRYYLSREPIPKLGRVVMLSPPNQGSEAADELMGLAVYKWVNGPAGQQLGTGPDGIAARLGPADFTLGIITGNDPGVFDVWFAGMFPGENDGKVSVERAKVEGMTDFLVLPYGHTFIMDEEEVINQTLYFLKYGNFQRE